MKKDTLKTILTVAGIAVGAIVVFIFLRACVITIF